MTEVIDYETGEVNELAIATAEQMELVEMAKEGLRGKSGRVWSSIQSDDLATRAKIVNAVADSEKLKKMVNKTIKAVDVITQKVVITDRNTGEQRPALRIVILDNEGNAWGSVSRGVETSLENIFAIYGEPTWEPYLPLMVTEKENAKGSFFTFTIDEKELSKLI